VVVKVDRTEAHSGIDDLRNSLLAGLAGFAMLVFALAWFGSGWLVRPIRDLTSAAADLRDGNLNRRTAISSPPELATLSTTLNQMARDLSSERAFLERRVLQRTAQLEASNRNLEAFAEVAAHDLSAPLRKIQMFGSRIVDSDDEPLGTRSRDYLERMTNSAVQMQEILAGLLEISRISPTGVDYADTDLGEVCVEVVSILEQEIAEAGGRVEIGDLPLVVANRSQMEQLMQNLIANAIKFHRPDEVPVVRVSSESLDEAEVAEGMAFKVVVADNGIGFDPDRSTAIFEMFTRLDRSFEGTGLGLATCLLIVQQHGGAIKASSEPGVGSTFSITLPADPGAGWITDAR